MQPTVNAFIQKGIGKHLKKVLARNGNDISTLQEHHRSVICDASINLELATIDWKSASNSLSIRLIYDLFAYAISVSRDTEGCQRLFDLLRVSRSPRTKLNKFFDCQDTITNTWFSSMGCAFTFELETLVFLALCRAIIPRELHHQISVYGDDTIVPSAWFDDVIEAGTVLGFRANYTKSFKTEPFRESCGADFLRGVSVRPFYFKGQLTIARLVAFRNFMRNKGMLECCPSLDEFLFNVNRDFIPVGPPSNIWGDSLGDGHIHDPDPSHWTRDSFYALVNSLDQRCDDHFLTFAKRKVKDYTCLKRADRLFPYYHASYEMFEDEEDVFSSADPYTIGASDRQEIAHVLFNGPSLSWATYFTNVLFRKIALTTALENIDNSRRSSLPVV